MTRQAQVKDLRATFDLLKVAFTPVPPIEDPAAAQMAAQGGAPPQGMPPEMAAQMAAQGGAPPQGMPPEMAAQMAAQGGAPPQAPPAEAGAGAPPELMGFLDEVVTTLHQVKVDNETGRQQLMKENSDIRQQLESLRAKMDKEQAVRAERSKNIQSLGL